MHVENEDIRKQIDYLLRRRFGTLTPPPPPTLRSAPGNNSDVARYAEIEAARAAFNAMPADEIKKLAEDEMRRETEARIEKMRREEAQLFFNLPQVSADLTYYSKLALWTVDEAIALSLDKAPGVVNYSKVMMEDERIIPHAWQFSPFPKEYSRRFELVKRALEAGILRPHTRSHLRHLLTTIRPVVFLES